LGSTSSRNLSRDTYKGNPIGGEEMKILTWIKKVVKKDPTLQEERIALKKRIEEVEKQLETLPEEIMKRIIKSIAEDGRIKQIMRIY